MASGVAETAAPTVGMAEVEAAMSVTRNGEKVATERERHADVLRRDAVTRTVDLLVAGAGPGHAAAVLIASVLGSQARMAGIRLHTSEYVR